MSIPLLITAVLLTLTVTCQALALHWQRKARTHSKK